MGVRRFFCCFFLSIAPFHTHLLSPLFFKTVQGRGQTMCPFRVHTSQVSSPLDRIQAHQTTTAVQPALWGQFSSEGLVWAEWVLQFPSFGCVLHQLLCLCKTCNDFTHHDSSEMSQDHESGFSGGTMLE